MAEVIRIGTRGSRLALAQSRQVAQAIEQLFPERGVELVQIETRGDRTTGPLADIGGKGLFTAELEQALRAGELDLAVHSAKDMPATTPDDLPILAVPQRADSRDALVSRLGPLAALPPGATVGTGSLRRSAFVRNLRPDLQIMPLRGNVETRLNKAIGQPAELDAVVLAMAGLVRSGLAESHGQYITPLDIEDFIPAAGQGALAIQAAENNALAETLAELDHAPTRQALLAERSVLQSLKVDCHSCIAVHIRPVENQWQALAMAAMPDGTQMQKLKTKAPTPQQAANEITEKLKSKGCEKFFRK